LRHSVSRSPGSGRAAPRRRKPRVAPDTPRERIVLDCGEDCPHCGGPLRLVGEDVSEILDLIAAKLKVVETTRQKKSCRRCERITQPEAPSRPIPRAMVGPALLAWILVSKFDDHLPSVIGRVWSMAMTVQRAGPYFCPWSARRHKMRTVEVGMLLNSTSASRRPWANSS
jgi:transposase